MALAFGCANNVTVFGGSGNGGSTGKGGGNGTGGAGVGGGSLCGVDCSSIVTAACHFAQCNPTTRQCEVLVASDGKSCDDGKFCTVQDACEAGTCTGVPNDCGMAAPECMLVVCDEQAKGCTLSAGSDGQFCTPTDKCEINGQCKGGMCYGQPNDCKFAQPPDACHVMKCNPGNGQCEAQAGNDNAPCTDKNALCTIGKTCNAGSCVGGSPKDCSSFTLGCNLGVCDSKNGNCTTQPVKDNQACDDLNACTSGEFCSNKTCGGGSSISQCKDADQCCPASCDGSNDSDCNVVVAGGLDFTCARLADATAKCWGFNQFGQLGAGNSGNSSNKPVAVSGLSQVVSLAAGNYHACATVKDGTVKCWGYNGNGEFGNGTMTSSNTPVQTSGISNAVAVATGATSSCALLSDSTVKCWGANFYGQLGDGSNVQNKSPVSVALLSDVASIASGAYHVCALVKGGSVKCWGYNALGSLGDGTKGNSNKPVDVKNITTAVAIASGGYHSCALLSDGTVKCWGYNSSGQLGDGSNANSTIPSSVFQLSGALSIAGGDYHSCAVVTGGAMKCWGGNFYGSLGDGTKTSTNKPVSVFGISAARSVDLGTSHSCAVLQGSIRCWGANKSGQLGNGTNTDSSLPVGVTGL
jgi:alpha-tubulin suppressor-like RCC1 family protein